MVLRIWSCAWMLLIFRVCWHRKDIYLHTYIHTHIHTYTHIHIHTYIHHLLHGAESFLRRANRFSASQDIPLILWNPKVHYRTHKCPPPVPILRQLDPVHTPTSHLLKTHIIIIIFPSTTEYSKWSLLPRFHHQNPLYASLSLSPPYITKTGKREVKEKNPFEDHCLLYRHSWKL